MTRFFFGVILLFFSSFNFSGADASTGFPVYVPYPLTVPYGTPYVLERSSVHIPEFPEDGSIEISKFDRAIGKLEGVFIFTHLLFENGWIFESRMPISDSSGGYEIRANIDYYLKGSPLFQTWGATGSTGSVYSQTPLLSITDWGGFGAFGWSIGESFLGEFSGSGKTELEFSANFGLDTAKFFVTRGPCRFDWRDYYLLGVGCEDESQTVNEVELTNFWRSGLPDAVLSVDVYYAYSENATPIPNPPTVALSIGATAALFSLTRKRKGAEKAR